MVGSKARAIRALASFGPSTAFLAAQRALEDPGSHDRPRYAYLLVELDGARAVGLLLRQCCRETSTAVRHAIARGLAAADVEADVARLLDSRVAEERVAGCTLCGFRTHAETLRETLQGLLQDFDLVVAKAALSALRRVRAAGRTAELVTAVVRQEVGRAERWVLLDALLRIGDLGDDGQLLPEWLRQVRAALTADMWDYAVSELKGRRKKYSDELRREDEGRQGA